MTPEILQLVNQLKIARERYYNGTPIMSDGDFDKLENMLREMDPTNSYFKTVGSPITRGTKIKHEIPMGSLEQITEDKEIAGWCESAISFQDGYPIVSAKLDGNSVALYYDENGDFYQAVTRGDGIEGLDITRHVRRMIQREIPPIPTSVPEPNLIIRAEAIVSIDKFKSVANYKNPRNYVGGQLNRAVADEQFINLCDIIAFGCNLDDLDKNVQLITLADYGFSVVEWDFMRSAINKKFLTEELELFRKSSPYEIDGVVLEISPTYKRKQLGYDNLNPEFARKFKINVNFLDTEVVDVHWKVSKDGYLKPRVEIIPIDLAGATITYTTGFNAKFIIDNQVGPGAIVRMTRSGDVIPYIDQVIKPSECDPDEYMPVDGQWNETGVDLVTEQSSGSYILQAVEFFRAIDAPMLKEGNVEKLFSGACMCNSIADIICLTEEQMVSALGENGFKAFAGLREKLSNIEEWKLMGALPFFGRGVGQRRMKKLVEAHGRLSNLTVEEIVAVDGFDYKTAEKIVAGYEQYDQFLRETINLIGIKFFEKVSGDLDHIKVCFTGVRSKELEKIIESRGGKILSSVTSECNYLVAKDPNGKSSKLSKARDRGVQVISLEEAQTLWL